MEKYYAESHEWVMALDDNTVVVGISDYAQSALGDIVFLSNAEVGDTVSLENVLGMSNPLRLYLKSYLLSMVKLWK